MQTIIFDELKRSFISVKSIIVIGAFLLVDYFGAKYNLILRAVLGPNAQLKVLFTGFVIMSTFFAFMLFSGILSRDIESNAIRYILPYIKRWKLILSKYVAMNLYFIVLLAITMLILEIHQSFSFPWESALNMIVFFAYIQALVMLLSTVLKERMSMFVGLAIGFAFPILESVLATQRHHLIYRLVEWLLPFRYIDAHWDILVLLLITALLLSASMVIFNRREV